MLQPGRSVSAGSYRYGFNGKENDNDVKKDGNNNNIVGGEQDYGMRIYDPRIGRWLAVDKLFKNYSFASPYNYALNSPIEGIDPDGNKVLFINGYYNTGKTDQGSPHWYGKVKGWLARELMGTKGKQDYWSSAFINTALTYFNDISKQFIDGRGAFTSSGKDRYEAGYTWAEANYQSLINGVVDKNGVQIETFKVVSHSMGAAYSEGIIKFLEEKSLKVEKVVHLSAADAGGFDVSSKPLTIQLNLENDPVLAYKNGSTSTPMKNVDIFGQAEPEGFLGVDGHINTKVSSVFKKVMDLENAKLVPIDQSEIIGGEIDYPNPSNQKYKLTGIKYGTNFQIIKKNGETYTKTGNQTYNNYGTQ